MYTSLRQNKNERINSLPNRGNLYSSIRAGGQDKLLRSSGSPQPRPLGQVYLMYVENLKFCVFVVRLLNGKLVL